MSEANKILAMQQDFVSFCTDVGPAGGSNIASHPRAFGAFPRLLARYVRELGALSLERAVAQASAGAANKVLAYDRGRIAVGLAADVIVFDAAEIADKATFAAPHELSVGMRHVFVNGVQVLDDGKFTGKRPGRVLRGPGYQPQKAPFAVSTGDMDKRLAPIDETIRSSWSKTAFPARRWPFRITAGSCWREVTVMPMSPREDRSTPTSLFRIASISKPITAVAIMQLVEQGKLRLEDRVFDILKYEPHLENDAKVDERCHDDHGRAFAAAPRRLGPRSFVRRHVPIRSLCQRAERAAAGPAATCDSLHARLAAGFQSRRAVRLLELWLLPVGPHYRGSIEAKLRIVCERARFRAAGNSVRANRENSDGRQFKRRRSALLFARRFDEVYLPTASKKRFPPRTADGIWKRWIRTAAGSRPRSTWPASPVRSMTVQIASCLNEDSIARMFAPPTGLSNDSKNADDNSYYSCGWMNRPVGDDGKFNSWHTGSLPGTATLLVRRHDGRNFVILFNARSSPDVEHFGRAIDAKLNQAINQVDQWPEVDLFEEF